MAAAQYLALLIALLIVMITTFGSLSSASDPGPLQDFCVADKMSNVFVNGFVCKDPKLVVPEDFFFSGLDKAGDTNNSLGSKVTNVNVENFPGLNTLGVSLARIDYEPNGLNPPHFHPRATEVITVLEGSLYLGFVTTNPNKFFTKTLSKGDVFVFPKSLIHFQMNTDRDRKAVAMSAFSSQNPGVVTVANAIFGSNPQISDDVLSKAFQVDKKTVDWLQAQFWTDNN